MSLDQHLSLFFSLFDAGIPWAVIDIAVLMASLGSYAIYCKDKKITRIIVTPWIVAFQFLMLYSTVIGRFQWVSLRPCLVIAPVSEGPEAHLMPFWSLHAIQEGVIEIMYEKISNIFFFVPYGALLAFYFINRRIRHSLIVGCMTSLAIELLQFITRTGTCETDDVICNTLGCGIGLIIAIGCMKLFKKVKIEKND